MIGEICHTFFRLIVLFYIYIFIRMTDVTDKIAIVGMPVIPEPASRTDWAATPPARRREKFVGDLSRQKIGFLLLYINRLRCDRCFCNHLSHPSCHQIQTIQWEKSVTDLSKPPRRSAADEMDASGDVFRLDVMKCNDLPPQAAAYFKIREVPVVVDDGSTVMVPAIEFVPAPSSEGENSNA